MSANFVLNIAEPSAGQYPFINFFKAAPFASGPTNYPSLFDINDYPTAPPVGSTLRYTPIQLPTSYSGNWVIDWEGQVGTAGTAAIQLLGPTTVVSGSSFVVGGTTFNMSMTGTNGRVVFNFTPTSQKTFDILTTASPSGFTNFRFYRADQESLLDSGEIFNPDFTDQLLELKAQGRLVLRFLDWSNANSRILHRYEDLTPDTAISWRAGYWRPANWVGDTSGTDTYTVANGPGHNALAYEAGEMITCRFVNSNTSTTPTINRGGLGPKTIVNQAGTALSAGNLNGARAIHYNALLDKFIYDTISPSPPFVVPLSVIVALCNKVGADLWLQYSLVFSEDAWTQAVQYCRDNLDSGLRLYTEPSNEVWNSGFFSTAPYTVHDD